MLLSDLSVLERRDVTKYLDYFPAPFLEDVVRGRCIPFIGAGFSLNAQLPPGIHMPDWDGIGRRAADALKDYNYTTAIEALSTYEHEFSRAKLTEFLVDALNTSVIQPGSAHDEFCTIPFDRVITTNWDFLLEAGYARASKYCMPIVSEDQLAVSSDTAWVRLLKLHGDLNHPSRIVATEEDYDGFLTRFPLLATYLSSLLIDNTAFFIGYSLDDPDLRQVWQLVKDRLGGLRRPAYTLQIGAAPQAIARFERRGVKVINLPKSDKSYSEVLMIAFRELREYWTETLPLISTSADPESQVELSMPAIAQNRIAFFAVPTAVAGFYKRHVYPVARRQGFTPVMAIDVVTVGDNIVAKVQALLEKSAVTIVDLDSRHTLYELGLARSIADRSIIVVTTIDLSTLPVDIRDLPIVVRPAGLDEQETDSSTLQFIEDLTARFAAAFAAISPALMSEPQRLLDQGEYRAAVLSAFSLLEHELMGAIVRHDIPLEQRRTGPASVREMLNALEPFLSADLVKRLVGYTSVRNRVAHSVVKVSRKTASAVVEDVAAAVATLTLAG
jgi:SIR2-like domain